MLEEGLPDQVKDRSLEREPNNSHTGHESRHPFKFLRHNYETIDLKAPSFADSYPKAEPKDSIAQMIYDIEGDLKEMDCLTQRAIDQIVQDSLNNGDSVPI